MDNRYFSKNTISNGPEKAEKVENKISTKLKGLFSAEKRKNAIISLVIAFVVICVAIGTVSCLSPKSVAERYIEAIIFNDVKTQVSLSAYDVKALLTSSYDDEDEFFEKKSDSYDVDINSWGSYYRVVKKDRKEDFEDEYGKYSYSPK